MEQLIPFVLIALFGYVALVWPQQRRNRAHRELLASIAEGDEIVLNSGIHGLVHEIEPDVYWVEVAFLDSSREPVVLKVAKASVSSKIAAPAGGDDEDS